MELVCSNRDLSNSFNKSVRAVLIDAEYGIEDPLKERFASIGCIEDAN